MKKIKISFIILTSAIILTGCGDSKPKIVYVDSAKLYTEFELTQELSSKMEQTFGTRKQILDSLELEVYSLSKLVEAEKGKNSERIALFNIKRDEFVMKKQQFEEDNQLLSQQYNEQITKQFNQYMNEFGKEKDYDVILGANGDGGIMYANEAIDVTDEALQFINGKYNGNPVTANK